MMKTAFAIIPRTTCFYRDVIYLDVNLYIEHLPTNTGAIKQGKAVLTLAFISTNGVHTCVVKFGTQTRVSGTLINVKITLVTSPAIVTNTTLKKKSSTRYRSITHKLAGIHIS